ncbi:hypothetical protein OAK75_05600 [Bacteriovoracales bacterium]|nr:hypothetical protein [Bacteriovoracales bacterium]
MKNLSFEKLFLAVIALFLLVIPLEVQSKQGFRPVLQKPSLLSAPDKILAKAPEHYKLKMLLKKHKKVYFKKNLEQDLFFYFGPYIRHKGHYSKEELKKFNNLLRELFRHHFN